MLTCCLRCLFCHSLRRLCNVSPSCRIYFLSSKFHVPLGLMGMPRFVSQSKYWNLVTFFLKKHQWTCFPRNFFRACLKICWKILYDIFQKYILFTAYAQGLRCEKPVFSRWLPLFVGLFLLFKWVLNKVPACKQATFFSLNFCRIFFNHNSLQNHYHKGPSWSILWVNRGVKQMK